MCLAMCLKKQEFQADCVYKLGVYKKKVCSYNGPLMYLDEWQNYSVELMFPSVRMSNILCFG